jgi:F420-dependent methylenetetrahydromethanopterin dehydrogenase
MDEPLVEIALRGVRGPPDELELLVGLEVPATPDQIEAAREFVHALRDTAYTATLAAVATILLCGVDLFFRGKLDALLSDHRLITVDHTELPDLVIVDISRVDAEEVADTYADVPILGYTNHTDTAGLRAAHAAGFDQVVVKSALVERCREIVAELTPST